MHNLDHVDCRTCTSSECIVARNCSPKWKTRINKDKTTSYYKKDQLIVKEETEAFGIYLIHSGKVLIVSEKKDLKKQIIRLAVPGDIIEHSSDSQFLTFPFSAEAFEDSIICYIPKETFFKLLKGDPKFTLQLEQFYTNKFVRAEKRLNNLVCMNVRAKVAEALLIVADAFDGEISLNRKELGELTCVSPEQVSRELKQLMEDKIIDKVGDKKKVVIKNLEGLLEIVHEYDQHYSDALGKVRKNRE